MGIIKPSAASHALSNMAAASNNHHSPRKQLKPNTSTSQLIINWLNLILATSQVPANEILKVKALKDLKDAVVFVKISIDLVKKSFTELAEVYRQMPELNNDQARRFDCVSTVFNTQLEIKSGVDFDLAAESNDFELAKVS